MNNELVDEKNDSGDKNDAVTELFGVSREESLAENVIDNNCGTECSSTSESCAPALLPNVSTKTRKRKEDKSYDFILRALSSLNSPEEKLAALCQKYADLFEEHRQVKDKVKNTTKLNIQLQRERDHLQSEHTKVVWAKSKLENVCRELQRHNKVIKEDSLTRAKEEEENRKEVSQKFQSTIIEVQNQMVDCHQRNSKLQEENKELAVKLKGLIDQYEKREEHLDKVYKHKELESQLCEARLAQSACALQEEQARHAAERERLVQENALLRKKVELLETQEATMREQIVFYTNKYEEFQDTVSRSNEIFSSVKSEMDKMSKKVKNTDKESMAWKRKFENGQQSVLKLAQEKKDYESEVQMLRSKISKLESLCRALQAERNTQSAAFSQNQPPTPTSTSKQQLPAEQSPAEQPPVEQPLVEQPLAEQPPAEPPSAEQPLADHPSAEQLSSTLSLSSLS